MRKNEKKTKQDHWEEDLDLS